MIVMKSFKKLPWNVVLKQSGSTDNSSQDNSDEIDHGMS